MWADAFPDGRITVDRVVADDPFVVVELTGQGTHTGTLRTAAGSVPATGRSVTLHLCDVYEFRHGKALSQHQYLDTGAMMAQLGITAEQPAATRQQ
jgi:predicted ester cyclase